MAPDDDAVVTWTLTVERWEEQARAELARTRAVRMSLPTGIVALGIGFGVLGGILGDPLWLLPALPTLAIGALVAHGVAVTAPERAQLEAAAERRGLPVDTTVRATEHGLEQQTPWMTELQSWSSVERVEPVGELIEVWLDHDRLGHRIPLDAFRDDAHRTAFLGRIAALRAAPAPQPELAAGPVCGSYRMTIPLLREWRPATGGSANHPFQLGLLGFAIVLAAWVHPAVGALTALVPFAVYGLITVNWLVDRRDWNRALAYHGSDEVVFSLDDDGVRWQHARGRCHFAWEHLTVDRGEQALWIQYDGGDDLPIPWSALPDRDATVSQIAAWAPEVQDRS